MKHRNLRKPPHSNCRSFEDICASTPNRVFGNHLNKLRAIDYLVDRSREGSLSDDDAKRMAESLFARKQNMTSSEFYEAQDLLDCVFKNNLSYGMANDFYNNYWVSNPERD